MELFSYCAFRIGSFGVIYETEFDIYSGTLRGVSSDIFKVELPEEFKKVFTYESIITPTSTIMSCVREVIEKCTTAVLVFCDSQYHVYIVYSNRVVMQSIYKNEEKIFYLSKPLVYFNGLELGILGYSTCPVLSYCVLPKMKLQYIFNVDSQWCVIDGHGRIVKSEFPPIEGHVLKEHQAELKKALIDVNSDVYAVTVVDNEIVYLRRTKE